uniref:Uncharacterized protein n=1 Tax=Anopheles merus TaxID=30066 RepID=A0A182V1J8_ANOME
MMRSSVSFSWLTLDADEAPQICISISASRCSTSHCCWASFALSVKFSDSTVCSRSRNRLISPSSASCDPSSGVAPDDSMCVSEPHGGPVPMGFNYFPSHTYLSGMVAIGAGRDGKPSGYGAAPPSCARSG